MFFRLFILLLFLLLSLNAHDLKKATLQLSWFDQFQFAGYYMAKEKGFYKQEDLDIEILPFEFGIDIPKKISEGKLDFAIGRETLILEQTKYKNLVALYSLFQATPLVLISTEKSGINEIADFKNKKIMTTIDDASEVSLKAMITSQKVDLKDLNFLKHTHDINDLINKKTDVISAYISKAPYELEKRGIKYNLFDSKKYGFDMYSDFLYTNKNLLSMHKDSVLAFKKASLKGWEYAYNNIEETVEVILQKYNPQKLSREELLYEAKELKKLSYFQTTKLGEIKQEKLRRIYDLYNILGLVHEPISFDDFSLEGQLNKISFSYSLKHKKYMESNDVVNMCIIPDSKPYSFLENGEFKGFIADYINFIEKNIGLRFNLVETKNFKESLEFLKNKKCDILASAENTKQRKKFANFTKSFHNAPFALVSRASSPFVYDVSILKGKKIALVKDYSSNKKIRDEYPEIDFVDVNNMNEAIQKVLDKELYGYIDSLHVSSYRLYSYDLSNLRVSSKLELSIPLSIAVRSDNQLLYEVLDTAVRNIDEKQKDELLKKWITIDYKEEVDYSLLWKVLSIISLILAVILYRQVLLAKLNDKLKVKVDEKSKELREINSQLEQRIKEEVEQNLKKDRIMSQQSKMISMGQMIENIAHQWRQPLSLITTAASGIKVRTQLEKGIDKTFLNDTLDAIIKTSNHLSSTIEDFRHFFKPQKEKEIFSLKECILKMVNLVDNNFLNKGIEIIIKQKEDIPINGYETELIQVFINILNNSRDAFSSQDRLDKYVFIEYFKKDNEAIIEIKDNANGIDEAIIEQVFEPYFTTKHKSQGTGIGLYMCQEMITKHMQGKIEIENVQYVFEGIQYKGALTRVTLSLE